MKSLVGEDHKEFSVEVQYLFQFSFNWIYLVSILHISEDDEEYIVLVDRVKVTVHLVPALSDATGYKDERYFRAAQQLAKHRRNGILMFCIDLLSCLTHLSLYLSPCLYSHPHPSSGAPPLCAVLS